MGIRFSARELLAPTLLFAVAFLAYLPALNGRFLWDDPAAIIKNPFMHQANGLWGIWTTIGQIPGEEHYWPLTYSVLWVQYQFWGDWTTGFHLVNFLLHGAIVMQIWRLMRRVGLPGAALGAALFAVHPVHAESVAWIISIKDLLAMLLYLVGAELYLNHTERGGWKWLLAAAVAALAGMLSKTTPLTLPFGLAILIWYRRGRVQHREAIGLAVLGFVVVTIALIDSRVVKHIEGTIGNVPPLPDRLLQAGRAFWFYVEKLFWPTGLSTIYPQWSISPAYWIPLIAGVLITIGLWLARARIGRGPLACWLFYGITLGPALGLIYFFFLRVSPVADRYQYLASLGPLAGIGAVAGSFMNKLDPRRRRWSYAPIALLFIMLIGLSWHQAGYYRDLETLFNRAVQVAPNSPEAHYNLGCGLDQKKEYAGAEHQFREAIRLRRSYVDAISDLGGMLMKQERIADAVAVYQPAIEHGYFVPEMLNNMAWMMATSDDPRIRNPALALKYAEQSASMKIDARTLNALAAAQSANGQSAKAAATAKQALKLAEETHAEGLVRTLNQLIPAYEQGLDINIAPRK